MYRQFLVLIFVLFLFFITSCTGNPSESPPVQDTYISTHAPSLAPTDMSQHTSTPIPTYTSTQLSIDHPLPTCTTIPSDYVYVIDNVLYDNVNPGLELGIWEAIDVMQRALETHHPVWAQYTWEDSDGKERNLAYYLWNKSRAQMIGVNPRVLLVTAGLALDWQIPSDKDLLDSIAEQGVTLTEHYREFKFNEDLRELFPQVANDPTYALYAFYNYDLNKLNNWVSEYDLLFGTLQPRILSDNCQPNLP